MNKSNIAKNTSSKTILIGFLWSFFSSGGKSLLQLLTTLLLAKMLSSNVFADIAIITGIMTIVDYVSQFGISAALIQKKKISKDVLNSVFSFTHFTFISAAIILFTCSNSIAVFFHKENLASLIKISCITLVFQGSASFYRSILTRELNFKYISTSVIFSSLINFIFAIFLAYKGYEAYSIVIGNLTGNFFLLLFFIYKIPFVPSKLGSFYNIKEMLKFGGWVSLGSLLGHCAGQFDRFYIAKFLGAKELAAYFLAFQIANTIPSLITSSLDQILFPFFSKNTSTMDRKIANYWQSLRLSSMIILPICFCISVYSKEIILIFLGSKWEYMTPFLCHLGFFAFIGGLGGGVFSSIINASALPQLNSFFGVFRFITLPLCIWTGSFWGMLGILKGVIVFAILGRLFNQYILSIYLKISFKKYLLFSYKIIILNLLFLTSNYLGKTYLISGRYLILEIFTCLVFSSIIYILSCFYLLKSDVLFLHHNILDFFYKKSKNY